MRRLILVALTLLSASSLYAQQTPARVDSSVWPTSQILRRGDQILVTEHSTIHYCKVIAISPDAISCHGDHHVGTAVFDRSTVSRLDWQTRDTSAHHIGPKFFKATGIVVIVSLVVAAYGSFPAAVVAVGGLAAMGFAAIYNSIDSIVSPPEDLPDPTIYLAPPTILPSPSAP